MTTAYQIFHLPKEQPLTAGSFVVLPGAKAYFYASTTSTPQDTYADSALTTPNANPVVADANGVFQAIYLNPALQYKLTLNTAADVLIYTIDPCNDQILTQALLGLYLYPRTPAEIAAGVTPVNYAYPPGNVLRYGTNATPGTTDMTTAIANALLGNAGFFVYLPTGIYKITSTLVIPAATSFYGDGPQRSILRRGFNGTMITATSATDIAVTDMTLDGNAPTNTGKGIVVSGSTSLRPVFDNLWSISMGAATDTHLEFGADAGQLAVVSRCSFRLGGGTLDFRAIHINGPDTVGAFRSFSQVQCGNAYIDVDGGFDNQFLNCSFMRIETDAATSIIQSVGCVWANIGGAMTLNAAIMDVHGCRFSGNVTLSSTFCGSFVGNTFSDVADTLTNNADIKACVLHMPLQGATFTTYLGRNTLTNRNGVDEIQTKATAIDIGNGSTTYTPDSSANVIRFNTAITADRTVTLGTPARDGQTVRVLRQAGATGAFNINVGTGPLKALAAASTWCEVTYSGFTAAWFLSAAGTL